MASLARSGMRAYRSSVLRSHGKQPKPVKPKTTQSDPDPPTKPSLSNDDYKRMSDKIRSRNHKQELLEFYWFTGLASYFVVNLYTIEPNKDNKDKTTDNKDKTTA